MKTTVRGGPQGPPPGLILILMKCTTRKPHRSSLWSAGPGIAAPPCSATTHVQRTSSVFIPIGSLQPRPPRRSWATVPVTQLLLPRIPATSTISTRLSMSCVVGVRRPQPTSTTEVSPAHHTTSAVSTTIKAQVGISWDGEVDSAIVQWDKQNWSPHGPVPVVHATAADALPT
jgi:hypothetical protein